MTESRPVELVLALKSLPLFADLEPQQLDSVANRARLREYHAGERITSGTRRAQHLHVVVSGKVRARLSDGDTRAFGQHDVVGGAAVLANSRLLVEANAMEDTTCLSLGYGHIEELVANSFALAHTMIRGAARAVRRARRPQSVPRKSAQYHASEFRTQLVERVALMHRTPSLRNLPVRVLADTAREASALQLAAGDALWQAGDAAAHFVVVRDGKVRVGTERDDGYVVEGPALLGSVDALAEEPRCSAAVALSHGTGISVSVQNFFDVLEDDSRAALVTLRLLATAALRIAERGGSGSP